MSADILASVSGVLVSLLFAYLPGLRDWFDGLDGTYKRLVLLASGLVTAGAIFGLSCANIDLLGVMVTCDKVGALECVRAFILFAVANQSTYTLLPKQYEIVSVDADGVVSDDYPEGR